MNACVPMANRLCVHMSLIMVAPQLECLFLVYSRVRSFSPLCFNLPPPLSIMLCARRPQLTPPLAPCIPYVHCTRGLIQVQENFQTKFQTCATTIGVVAFGEKPPLS